MPDTQTELPIAVSKVCRKCGKTKPLVEFDVVRNRPCGYRASCKPCCRRTEFKEGMPGENRPCAYCGKVVFVLPHRAERADVFFCCANHHLLWLMENTPSFECIMCCKPFRRRASLAKLGMKYCSVRCYLSDPNQAQRLRVMNANQHGKMNSRLERAGYAILDGLKLNHLRQHLLYGKFCVDAFLPEYNAVIQFDGDYWHGNPAVFPTLNSIQAKNTQLDKAQNAYLEKCGVKVLRLWGSAARCITSACQI